MPPKQVQRRLALAPEDWFWAAWRELRPLPAPRPAPFDREVAIERLRAAAHGDQVSEPPGIWSALRAVPAMEREEAAFWLHVLRLAADVRSGKPLLERVRAGTSPGSLPEDPAEVLLSIQTWRTEDVWVPLRALFPVGRLVDGAVRFAAGQRSHWTFWHHTLPALIRGFRRHILGYLTPAGVDEARDAVAPHLASIAWPSGPDDPPPLALLFAAALGMHDAVRAPVQALTGEAPSLTLDVVFGLGSAAEVEEQVRRLKLRLREPRYARAWLAHTEYSALDWLRDSIVAEKRSGRAAPLARVLALVHAPEAAPIMLEVLHRSRAPRIARNWFETNPGHGAAGLVSLCVERGRVHEAPVQTLRSLHAGGHAAIVEAALEAAGPAAARLREAVTGSRDETVPLFDPGSLPSDLQDSFRAAPPPLPRFLAGQELPPVLIDGRRLTDDHLAVFLAALRESTLEGLHPLVGALKERAGPVACDRLALKVFEVWLWAGMPRKESWALTAAGVMGGDACALRLGPLAVEWRKKLIHQPAKDAIDCLKGIGTDTALLQLRNFTRIPREWALKETAEQYLREAAESRGLTPAELEERMVPDCGLDSRGSRTFDFGSRRFTLALGPAARPMVRDGGGRLLADLPKPGAKDDPALSEASAAAWKLLKKQLGEVLKLQSARLEQAMVTGGRWSPGDFETLIARHPVITLLARGLVWAAYDASGSLAATFRVAEDQSLADPADAPFDPGHAASIGIPHPLHLSPELRGAWGEVVSDYELTAPFPQLGRPLHFPEPDAADLVEVTRFNGIPCLAMALVDGLERRGWQRGDPGDGGYFSTHLRDFPSGITARAEYSPGVSVWDGRSADLQEITGVSFFRGVAPGPRYSRSLRDADRLPLRQVDPVVYSEVMADLAALTAR
jgi:hypothetical protein